MAPNLLMPMAPNHLMPMAPNHLMPMAPNHLMPMAPKVPFLAYGCWCRQVVRVHFHMTQFANKNSDITKH